MPSTKMKKITEKKPKYDFDGRKFNRRKIR